MAAIQPRPFPQTQASLSSNPVYKVSDKQEDRLKRVESALSSLKTSHQTLKEKYNAQQMVNDHLNIQCAQLSIKQQTLTESLILNQEYLKEMVENCSKVVQDNQVLRTENHKLKTENQGLKTEIEVLQIETNQSKQLQEETSLAYDNLKNQNEQLAKEKKIHAQKLEERNIALEQQNIQLTEENKKLNVLKKELERTDEINKVKIENLDKKAKENGNKYSVSEEQRRVTTIKLEKLSKQMHKNGNLYSVAEERLRVSKVNVKKLQTQWENSHLLSVMKLTEAESKIEKMGQEVQGLVKANEEARVLISELLAENQTLKPGNGGGGPVDVNEIGLRENQLMEKEKALIAKQEVLAKKVEACIELNNKYAADYEKLKNIIRKMLIMDFKNDANKTSQWLVEELKQHHFTQTDIDNGLKQFKDFANLSQSQKRWRNTAGVSLITNVLFGILVLTRR